MGIQINGQTDTVTATDGSINVGGDVTIPGVLTYEDVTNVDSVGVITARDGIRVTGGSVGIGTDNPSHELDIESVSPTIELKDSDNDYKFQLTQSGSATYVDFDTGGGGSSSLRIRNAYDEKIRITAGGSIGIGTNNPLSKIEVNAASSPHITSVLGQSDHITMTTGTTGSGFNVTTGNHFAINHQPFADRGGDSNLTERLRITSDGKVGIGTDNPQANLHLFEGTGSTQAPAASGNNLVIDGNTEVGMSLLFGTTASTAYGNIYWGNSTDGSADGRITYFGSTYTTAADRQSMVIRTAGSERLRIGAGGTVYIGPNGSTFNPRGQLHIERALTYSDNNYRNSNLLTLENTLNDEQTVQTFIGNFSGSNRYGNIIWTPGSSNDVSTFKINANIQDANHFTIRGDGKVGVGGLAESSALFGIRGSSTEELGNSDGLYNQSNPCFLQIKNTTDDISDPECGIILQPRNSSNGSVAIYAKRISGFKGELIYRFRTASSTSAERFRFTNDGDFLYDQNKGGIYNFDKACGSNTSTNIFRIDNEHGAHCFTIYMTGSNSGNSVSKIYHVACKYGSSPTISSAADSGAYSGNNFSLTGSVSGSQHTFAISVTGAAATVSCTIVLGSLNTGATVTKL